MAAFRNAVNLQRSGKVSGHGELQFPQPCHVFPHQFHFLENFRISNNSSLVDIDPEQPNGWLDHRKGFRPGYDEVFIIQHFHDRAGLDSLAFGILGGLALPVLRFPFFPCLAGFSSSECGFDFLFAVQLFRQQEGERVWVV
jgi:hypothetical protein